MGGPGYDLNQWQHGDMAVLLHLCVSWWVVLSVAIATFRVCIVTWLARGGGLVSTLCCNTFSLCGC